ncbi:acrosomal protein SP-10 [Neophocaena asiaeorientalis asiaeorientalis]|uniref:Acrosomal protein SP-10 n=1 Tax=Neophocaena asiaeorientalis asiaeorientalis TaxID=1706337 RepID=A0A341B4A9_NEOAA|nr:acrosomal protein SP-10 [Neophocaena asiaeorientalis asiaeorientalis]
MKKCLLLVSLYLLGSARGASGQSDELLGSMGHQASVQQPSGDYFSLENPSDGEALYETSSGENTLSEHGSSEHSAVKHASRGHAAGEHASSEQPSGEKTSGERPAGEQPSGIPPSSTVSGPVLNCHTCSYMNDQGKCLQGEGVCSTQNSQQCMLKKIFEGRKLQFIVQGCENMCPAMNHLSHGTRMQVICCRNQSFCNKV